MDKIDESILSMIEESDNALLECANGEHGEEQHRFSSSFNAEMDQLYRESKPTHNLKLIRRIVVLAATLILLVSTVTAAAFWEEIAAFFEDMFGTYSELRVEVDDETEIIPKDGIPREWGSRWIPSILPDGYSFKFAEERRGVRTISFQDNGGAVLTFKQWQTYKSIANDNEGTLIEGIKVGSFETFAFEKNIGNSAIRTLAWSNGDSSFRLIGQLAFSEMKKTAESIVFIDLE